MPPRAALHTFSSSTIVIVFFALRFYFYGACDKYALEVPHFLQGLEY